MDICDSLGRLAFKLETDTWYVEASYKGCKTKTHLALGETFTIERQGQVTSVTRIDNLNFEVQRSYSVNI